MTILAFIFWVVIALFSSGIVTHRKDTQPKNKVHFYVARDKNGDDYYKERDKRYNRFKTYIEEKNKKENEDNERKLYERLKKKYEKS